MSLVNSEILFEDLERDKVSVIMPAYNCESYIDETIQSLLNQTYTNWELVVVDDCSTDRTGEILQQYAKIDKRIKYVKNEHNLHAAASRNRAIRLAKGQYLAFLDSDDIWKDDKLEKQLSFMKKNNCVFCCTAYGKVDENGMVLDWVVKTEKVSKYWDVLKNCPGNLTVVYDAIALGKHIIPDIHNREDYVMWLSVVKSAKILVGMNEILAFHRIRNGSASSKKIVLIKYHWCIYRNIENLSLIKSASLIFYWIAKGLVNKFFKVGLTKKNGEKNG